MTEGRRSVWLRTSALGAVIAAWLPCWLVRRNYSSPNVDDYLYSIVARQLWAPLAEGDLRGTISAFLHTGQNAPLVPALGAPLSGFGPDVVVLVQLPFMLLLTALVFAIINRVSRAETALVGVLITALAAPVLNWSLMVHMALASSVCTLGVLYFYLRSSGFARRWPSVGVGVSIGLLALSRSMAPVYVATVVATMLLGVFRYHRPDAIKNARNVAMGIAAAGIVAGPWYWKSGPVALSYLRSVGYSPRSGFVASGNPVRIRFETTWHEVGYALAALLTLMCVVSLIGRLRGRRPVQSQDARETRFVLFVFAGLVMVFLSTSGVGGTAFDLPAIATFIPALVLCLPSDGLAVKIIAPAGVVVSCLGIMQACLVAGWEERFSAAPAPMYAAGLWGAVGSPRSDLGSLTQMIGELAGDQNIFVTRDDAVVNVPGLHYFKIKRGYHGVVRAPSFDPAKRRISVPPDFEFALTGQSCAPYHRHIDRDYLESSLRDTGWSTVLSSRLSPCNDIVLWRRPSPYTAVP